MGKLAFAGARLAAHQQRAARGLGGPQGEDVIRLKLVVGGGP